MPLVWHRKMQLQTNDHRRPHLIAKLSSDRAHPHDVICMGNHSSFVVFLTLTFLVFVCMTPNTIHTHTWLCMGTETVQNASDTFIVYWWIFLHQPIHRHRFRLGRRTVKSTNLFDKHCSGELCLTRLILTRCLLWCPFGGKTSRNSTTATP